MPHAHRPPQRRASGLSKNPPLEANHGNHPAHRPRRCCARRCHRDAGAGRRATATARCRPGATCCRSPSWSLHAAHTAMRSSSPPSWTRAPKPMMSRPRSSAWMDSVLSSVCIISGSATRRAGPHLPDCPASACFSTRRRPRRPRRDGDGQRRSRGGCAPSRRPGPRASPAGSPARTGCPPARPTRMPSMSMSPSPGNSRSKRAVWISPAVVVGISPGASHTWA